MSHVQVGWGWVEAWRASFLPLYNPAWPSGNGVEGKAEGLLESLVWVCVLQGFHFFLCVCFCCKLPTDVSSWATPDQLEVVMRCCHNCAFCDFFFSFALLGLLFSVVEMDLSSLVFCFVFGINVF